MSTLFDTLQEKLGVTKYEILFVALIFSGLLIGLFIKIFDYRDLKKFENNPVVFNLLDSLAEAQKTSYIGSDAENKPDEILARADTVIKDKKTFPQYKKKELPKNKININTASKRELMNLPGVGEKTADLIIEYRKNKKFRIPRDIMNINGIGPKKYEKMAPYILTD